LPTYRLYRVDGAGNIMSAEWIEAVSDAEAERVAREQLAHGIAELWERDRLVARLKPGETPPGA
jgi:hypothetical protein